MSDPKDTRQIEINDGSLSVPDGSLQPGQVLQGRYRVLGIIGMGGMGAVYQARDLNFPNVVRLCAIKEMINLAQDQQIREQMMSQFIREAEVLATVDHPAIPKIYDFFSFGDRSYLVMEFIQGRDLETILNSTDKLLPVDQVRDWSIAICDVLSYLHNHEPEPIIFRDMKPSNVMIDARRAVRLIDFGIAKTFQMGQPGTMIGTEGYSPPEQYRGNATLLADIYALGATIHHLLTRRDPRLEPPFSFDQKPIQAYNPNVSDEFAAVVMKALSYDPADRYQNADEMKQALVAIDQHDFEVPADVEPAVQVSARPYDQQVEEPIEQIPIEPTVSPIWSFKVEDAVRSTPVIYNNVVYVGSYDNNLWAIDAKEGSLIWKFPTGGGIGSSPYYDSGTIYIGSTDQNMYAIDVRSQQKKWHFKTNDRIYTTPRVDSGVVFFGSDDGNFYAIKPISSNKARELWAYNVEAPIRSSPAIENGYIFFGTDAGDCFALDMEGNVAWRFQTRRRIMSSPFVKDNIVYIGSDDWYMYGLDFEHGYPIWRTRTAGAVISSPIFGDGKVFFGSADGSVYALDALSGRRMWKYDVGSKVTSSPCIWQESIYIGAVDGALYCLHARTGDLLWRFQSDGPILSSPQVFENIVYIGSDDQYIYALQA